MAPGVMALVLSSISASFRWMLVLPLSWGATAVRTSLTTCDSFTLGTVILLVGRCRYRDQVGSIEFVRLILLSIDLVSNQCPLSASCAKPTPRPANGPTSPL